MSAIDDVAAERQRQVEVEGWTASHDDTHQNGELTLAAACYACCDQFPAYALNMWPYDAEWWKPKTNRRNLVMAAALLVAEIERIDRATARDQPGAGAASERPSP